MKACQIFVVYGMCLSQGANDICQRGCDNINNVDAKYKQGIFCENNELGLVSSEWQIKVDSLKMPYGQLYCKSEMQANNPDLRKGL